MSRPSRIAIVKELGSRSPRCLAAHAARGQDEPELVIVERYPAVLGPDVLAQLEEEAKELVTFEQANVATVIASVKLKGDVAILSEWVDGESLASCLANDQKPSLEILLRVLSDVCDAVTALHGQNGRRVRRARCGRRVRRRRRRDAHHEILSRKKFRRACSVRVDSRRCRPIFCAAKKRRAATSSRSERSRGSVSAARRFSKR